MNKFLFLNKSKTGMSFSTYECALSFATNYKSLQSGVLVLTDYPLTVLGNINYTPHLILALCITVFEPSSENITR